MFVPAKQASEKWGIFDRRIRVLCAVGKILNAYQKGRGWKIPADAINCRGTLQIEGEPFVTNRSQEGRTSRFNFL